MGIIGRGMRADARDELRSQDPELAARLDAADAREDAADWHHVSLVNTDQPEKPVLATFYMVRNDKGEYYRTYAQGGRRSGWVKELSDGRLWTTKGPAQGKITALANERPKEPVPQLVEFVVHEVKVVDQQDRVAKARLKKQEEKLRNEAYWKKVAVVEAEKELAEAQRRLEKLRRG